MILSSCALSYSFGQDSEISWMHNFGGSENDEARSIITTKDGGNLVGGFSYSTDGLLTGNEGWQDGWVLKTNAQGLIEWQVSLGGNDADVIESVKEVKDGYVLAGWSASKDDQYIQSQGLEDGVVAKIDHYGNLVWINSLGGSSMDKFFDLEIMANGDLVALGYSLSSDGDLSNNDTHGQLDIWVVKFTSNGQLIWQKNLGGSDDDFAYDLVVSRNGDLLIAGTSGSIDGQINGSNKGEWDFWTICLSSEGDWLWNNSYGYSGSDEARVILESEDYIYVVGNSNSSDRMNSSGSYDAWLLQLDHEGNYINDFSYGGSSADQIHSALLIGDHIVLAGETKTGDRLDGWIVTCSTEGEILHSQLIGGSNVDIIYDIVMNGNAMIVAGSSNSSDGDISQNFGASDVLMGAIGGKISSYTDESILLFPNPATSMINIVLDQIGIEEVKIYSVSGQILYTRNGNNFFQEQIDISSWPSGVYLVETLSHSQLSQKRFVKL